MANTKDFDTLFADYDPYRWSCSLCGKEQEYTQEEIDKRKLAYPDPHNHDFDFYISCPFCDKGVMQPPHMIFFGGACEDFGDD